MLTLKVTSQSIHTIHFKLNIHEMQMNVIRFNEKNSSQFVQPIFANLYE